MDAQNTLIIIGRILGFVILLQSYEFIKIKESFSEKGIWRWSELRTEYLFLPKTIGQFLDAVMNEKVFTRLMVVRFFLAAVVLLYPFIPSIFAFLFLTTFLVTLRWRGSFNGGSDYMLLILLLSLSVGLFFPFLAKGALWYITLQVISSYFLAGLHKVKKEKWYQGLAVTSFASSPQYQVPALILKKVQDSNWAKFFTWSVLSFELTFPLVIVNPLLTKSYLVAGCFFHLGNFVVFGLNRFFWVWIASYPAIYFCSRYFLS